jgi:hypothetical protein
VATLTAAHFVDSDITEGTSGSDSWTSTSPQAQARTTAFPQNRKHLAGETVQILDDGVVVATQTVSAGGTVTGITGTYHIGLAYTSELKPTKLDIEGMGLALTKKVTKAIISFYNTLEGKYGLTTSSLYDIPFDTTLFTGIKEVAFRGQYEREGDIIIQQTQPLPMVTRGLILQLGAHNK